MANLAFVSYVVEGDRNDLERLDKVFRKTMEGGMELRVDYGYPLSRFIEKVGEELGITNPGDWELQGVLSDGYRYDAEKGEISFSCVNAWHNNFTFDELIALYAPSAKVYFYCDADDGFYSNDDECRHFQSKYKIDAYVDGREVYRGYGSLEDFLEDFNGLMGTDCGTFEEAEEAADGYDGDGHVNVYE